MPTYVYEYTDGPLKGIQVEIKQSIKAPAYTHHPVNHHPITRVVTAPGMILGADNDQYSQNATLKDNAKLEKMGFTKLQRQSDGTYERVAGKEGPRHIDPRGFKE